MKKFVIVPLLVIFSLTAIAADLRIKYPPHEFFHSDRGVTSDTLTVTNAEGKVVLSGRVNQFENRPFPLPAGTYNATLNYFDEEMLPLQKEFIIQENLGKTLYLRFVFNFGPLPEIFQNQTYPPRRPFYIWAESHQDVSAISLVSEGAVLIKSMEIFMELNYRSFYHDGESKRCMSGLSLGRFAMNEANIPLLQINNVAASVKMDGAERATSVGRLTIQIPTVANYEIFSHNRADQVALLTTCLWPDDEHMQRIFNGDTELVLPAGEYVIETMGDTKSFTVIEGKTTSLYF
jgi:hypothetical protein